MTPGIYHVEVIFTISPGDLKSYIPKALGQLVQIDEYHTQFSCFVQNLGWIAGFLAGIPFSFKIIKPEALRQEMTQLVMRVTENLTEVDSQT